MVLNGLCTNIWRKKTVVTSTLLDTKLKRCLGLIDLIGLGLGSSLGVGVYVVMSHSISTQAGPSFVISVIIAGVATLFAGLCYAEFSSRLPKAGSCYLYSYVTLGEILGFIVGWNMILEHIITTAVAAKAWSQYLDFLSNGTIHSLVQNKLQWNGYGVFGECPDVVACAITLFITLIIAIKAKITSVVIMILAFFNILIIMCLVCIGYFHVKHDNWTNPPGFFAHGFSGVLKGAASLMFVFTNLEAITSASEETKDPSRTMPTSITYSVFICFVTYFCTVTATTLSLHVFPEDDSLTLPGIMSTLHIHGANIVIAIGGLVGLTASIAGNIYFLSRQTFAMANSGLLFKSLSLINDTTKQPVYSVLAAGCMSSMVALVLDLEVLLELVSIGTLLAYSVIAITVICLRYQTGAVGLYMEYEDPDDIYMQSTDFTYGSVQLDAGKQSNKLNQSYQQSTMYNSTVGYSNGYRNTGTNFMKKSLSFDDSVKFSNISNETSYKRPRDSTYIRVDSIISNTSNGSVTGLLRLPPDVMVEPNDATWRSVTIGLLVFIVSSVLFCVTYLCCEHLFHLESWMVLIIVFLFTVILGSATGYISKQPNNRTKLYFRSPYVPFIPLLSIVINVFLVASLPVLCWLRFIVWMTIGIVVYTCYGYRHSSEHQTDEQEVILYEITDDSNEPN